MGYLNKNHSVCMLCCNCGIKLLIVFALSDVLAFARAMQEALAKKSDAGSGEDDKPTDES